MGNEAGKLSLKKRFSFGNKGNAKVDDALVAAVFNDDDATLTILLECGANPNHRHAETGMTPLLLAASLDRDELMFDALLRAGADVNVQDETGNTPLHLAAQDGALSSLSLLLAANATVNVRNELGRTPLHNAAEQGHLEACERLVEAGALVNATEWSGETPLFAATREGEIHVVSYLLNDTRVVVDAVANDGDTPLCVAVSTMPASSVELFIRRGANINHRGDEGMTPLCVAASVQDVDVVRLLLQFGADVDCCCANGMSPLSYAAMLGDMTIVRLLLDANAIVRRDDVPLRRTPLEVAKKNEHQDIVKMLLQAADKKSETRLEAPSFEILLERFQRLCGSQPIESGTESERSPVPYTAVHDETHRSGEQSEVAPDVLAAINAGDDGPSRLQSDLARAVDKNLTATAERALQAGADPNVTDSTHGVLLCRAALQGSVPMVDLLLTAGAIVNATGSDGHSALMFAVLGQHHRVIDRLIKAHADVNQPTAGGCCPLYAAASYGYDAVVRVLVAAGADVNQSNEAYWSPLLVSVHGGHAGIVETLLNAGANRLAVTHTNETAMAIATRCQRKDLIALLEAPPELLDAVQSSDIYRAMACLRRGDDPNMHTADGTPLLHVAVRRGDRDILRALLRSKRILIDQTNGAGETAFVYATTTARHDMADAIQAECLRRGHPLAIPALHVASDPTPSPSPTSPVIKEVVPTLVVASSADDEQASSTQDAPATTIALVDALRTGQRDVASALYAATYTPPIEVDDDDYTVSSTILGTGGFAVVYAGTFRGQDVAVKRLVRRYHHNHSRTWQDEVNANIRCPSPYIVQLLALSSSSATHQDLIFERMDAGDLFTLLRQKRHLGTHLPYTDVAIAHAVASALCDLHSRRLVHLDLKSANVLLCSKGFVKVADLGLACENDSHTKTAEKGTIGYIAPEVWVGGKYGAAADVYSLGVLLIELCTLDRPFPELTKPFDVYLAVVNERRRPELPKDVAPWFRRLTEACLSHDPRGRPSATEIVSCLVAHLDDASSVEPIVDVTPESTPTNETASTKETAPTEEPAPEPTAKVAVEAAPVDRPLENDVVVPSVRCVVCDATHSFLQTHCDLCGESLPDASVKLRVVVRRLSQQSNRVETSMRCEWCYTANAALAERCIDCDEPLCSSERKLQILSKRLQRATQSA